MDYPVHRTIDFIKSSGGEKTMILDFILGFFFGTMTGYAVGAIVTMAKKDEEAADGKDMQ